MPQPNEGDIVDPRIARAEHGWSSSHSLERCFRRGLRIAEPESMSRRKCCYN
jgi:hypothetical protein